MITIYTANTPNGVKATIAMEELGLKPGSDYKLEILNLSARDQRKPDYLKINPNGRIPAMVDTVNGQTIRVFESGAMLLYLAEKYGQLLPKDPATRIEAIAWTYFQTGGIGPMMGQAGYFRRHHPEFEPGYQRYLDESLRLVGVMETVLKERDYLAGSEYSIADIMHIGWIDLAPGYVGLDLSQFPAVTKWRDRILARTAVQKGFASLAK